MNPFAWWAGRALATRLTLWYVGVQALLFVALSVALYSSASTWLERRTYAQLRAYARGVRDSLASRQDAERVLGSDPAVWASVVLPGGTVAARYGGVAASQVETPSWALAALERGAGEWAGQFQSRLGPMAAVLIPVPDSALRQLPNTTTSGPGATIELLPPGGLPPPLDGSEIAAANAGSANPATAAGLSPRPPSAPEPPIAPAGGDALRRARVESPADVTRGFVQVSAPTANRSIILGTLLPLSIGGSGVALLLTALVGPLLTRAALRPLRAVAQASSQLAAGSLGARVPQPASRDEVGELARSFNGMAGRLEETFAELQSANEALRAANAAQRAFVADASHELRTPLTALGGQLDVLPRAARDDPAEAERLAQTMRREVTRMSRLVEDLLTLARLDAQGAGALRLAPVNLSAIAHDVCEQVRALPAARDWSVQLRSSGSVAVRGDRHRLHQVLLNVTANALDHASACGRVVVTTGAGPDAGWVTVEDDGPGIPDEHLVRIFDRFYRLDRARDRASGGAGLGLAISRAIVEAHGGTIGAANAPAGGALFTISLPLAPQTVAHASPRAPEPEIAVAGSDESRSRAGHTSAR